jgi:N-acetylglucosamine-6-phosphate deacetylase
MQTGGLIDLQVNGFAGVDFNSGTITAAEMDRALEAMLATGVTTCLPTLITANPEGLMARFKALDAAVAASRLGPLMCPGYHLEGPFLNPAPGYAGCHPPGAMSVADPGLVRHLQEGLSRPILMVTVAPEIAGVPALIGQLVKQGCVVALGHSAVDFDQAGQAAAAGATLSTHLGNGVPQNVHKLINPIFAQLAEDRLWASFIADGIHLHPKSLQSLIRAKGMQRSILVTDAVAGAAVAPGHYGFANMQIERRPDGSVRQAGTNLLAGSALCLDQAIRNIVGWAIATPMEAIAMASHHPRAVLEPALVAHGLAMTPGKVEWSDDLRVITVQAGQFTRHFGKAAVPRF